MIGDVQQYQRLVLDEEYGYLIGHEYFCPAHPVSGYAAGDADAAIELLNKHLDIRLVFTEIDMPGSLDGLKLAAVVRDPWPPVKIIVTSGACRIEAADLPDGSVFFGKPYQHDAVVRSMHEMLAT